MNKFRILAVAFLLGSSSLFAQVKIGDNSNEIAPQALLELESTTKGLVIPRMTTAQRDAAFDQSTPLGMVIFNIDQNKLQYFKRLYDASGKQTDLKVWEGATDEIVTTSEGGTSTVENPTPGDLFYNEEENILYAYSSTTNNWMPIGNVSTSSVSSSTNTTLFADYGSSGQILSSTGTTTVWIDFPTTQVVSQGTPGPAGPAGATGPAGADGQDGAGFLVGAGVPTASVASATYYVDTGTGDQYYNTGGGAVWTALPITGLQNLSASALSVNNTMTLSVSNGNTITLDFSSISSGSNTDSQTISAALVGSVLELRPENITSSVTVDLNSLTGTDSQTLALAGQVLTISSGNSVTLANTNTDSQTLSLDALATSTQTTLTISDGNAISLTASGSIRFTQTGTSVLEIYDVGSLPAPLSGTNTNSTLRWNGSNWVTNTALESDGSNQATVTGDFNVTNNTNLATTTFNNVIYDANGDPGHPGQVLSATATGTNWISTSSGLVTLTTGNYTANIEDGTILVQPTTATTITLPTPSAAQNGMRLSIKRANTYQSTGDTLQISSPVNIDGGSSTLNLNVSFQGYTLQAFNGMWYITQRF